MPAATTMALVSAGITAGSTGLSFAQASKARQEQEKARGHAKKAIADARGRLDVNFYDNLSIVREPYQLEREALLSAGATAIDAAREGQPRNLSATAGRVQMAQNEGQRKIAGAMGQELMGLEKLSAQEDSRLRDANVMIDLEEAAGAQLALANNWEMEQQATQRAMSGVSSLATQAAGIPDIYANENLNMNQPLPMEYEGMKLNPVYQGKPLGQIISELQGTGSMPSNTKEIDYGQLYQLIYQR